MVGDVKVPDVFDMVTSPDVRPFRPEGSHRKSGRIHATEVRGEMDDVLPTWLCLSNLLFVVILAPPFKQRVPLLESLLDRRSPGVLHPPVVHDASAFFDRDFA